MTFKIIRTRRKNGQFVGREVSRQRRWQIRNPEKDKEIKARYKRSSK